MSMTVVGSIAFDSVKTPFGERDRMLGGAATHFALAASFFDDVRPVSPVGEDFGESELAVLAARGTHVADVQRIDGGKTFFWKGEHGRDLNLRETLDTQLNVFETFAPALSDQGENGAALITADGFFSLPAYSLDTVVDPTGAGDTFAGGFVGPVEIGN